MNTLGFTLGKYLILVMCIEKCFTQHFILTEYGRSHIGEIPYKCYVCRKSLAHKCILTYNVRVQTGERPYNCYVWENVLYRNVGFTLEKGPINVMCVVKICTEMYDRTLKVHSGETLYNCDMWKKLYTQISIK